MSYCVNCGVELEASLRECPLCHTPVVNPVEAGKEFPPSPYPVNKGQVEVVKRKDLGILLSVVLIATGGTCLLLNLLVFNRSLWSLLVIGICICLFVFTFPAVFYSKMPVFLSLFADGLSDSLHHMVLGTGAAHRGTRHARHGSLYSARKKGALHDSFGRPVPVY